MTHVIDQKYNKSNIWKLFIKGFMIGLANAIPGVSGGTLAFIFGIYSDLIDSIKSFNLQFFKLIFTLKWQAALQQIPWIFLTTVTLGAGIAILTLSKILAWLFVHQPTLILSFFFGLIVATVPIMSSVIKKWTPAKHALLFIASIGTYHLVGLVPFQTPETMWFIFLCGLFAMTTMILPGISGSFLLLILGKYLFIIEAVNAFNLPVLIIFMAGAIVGVISTARLLSYLFEKWHDPTMLILTGFVIGSLRKIWPWKQTLSSITNVKGEVIPTQQVNILPPEPTSELFWAVILMLLGFLFALIIHKSTISSERSQPSL